jgi:Fe-S oxidoreductase
VRKSFGDPVAEDLRFVVKKVVGEENFIDMYPNRSNNFCCGGGGGFLQSGYPDERRANTANSRPTRYWPPAAHTQSRPATTATPKSTI